MIKAVLAAMAGTVAFSALFGVPSCYYAYCGLTGGAGWAIYQLCAGYLGEAESCLIAAMAVVLLSRFRGGWSCDRARDCVCFRAAAAAFPENSRTER